MNFHGNSFNKLEAEAASMGFKVLEDGKLIGKRGKQISGHVAQSCGGYLVFKLERNHKTVRVHRLQAYQIFGDSIYAEGICVRHLNGNRLDNRASNIALGTQQENMLDRDPKERRAHAIKAAKKAQKHDHEKILQMHSAGLSYNRIMSETGIRSKGTISFIVKCSLARSKKETL